MANRSLGQLTLDLVAKIGGFTAGMTEAERAADKSAKKIEASMKSIGIAGYAVGTALGGFLKDGIVAAAAAFPALLEQVAEFQDLAEKTGASAEGLASFAVSAKVTGTSMEDIASASVKLTKNLVDVDDKGSKAGAALKAIGISIAEFKKLSPDEQFEKIATSLAGFQEGAGKTAVAVDLLGKSGANLLPFFKDLAEAGGRQKILTGEQIKLADDYLDSIARTKAQIGLYAGAISTQALPAITAFTGVLKDSIVEVYNLDKAAAALGGSNGFAVFAEDVGRQLAKVLDYIATTKKELEVLGDFAASSAKAAGQALSFDFSGARQTGEEFRARYGLDELGRKVQADSGKQAARTFVQAYNDELGRAKRTAFSSVDPRRVDLGKDGKPKDDRPVLKPPKTPGGGGGAADDPTKKQLDNDLKAFKAQGDQAKELLADRNKILDLYNSQGLISVKDYYEALRGNAEEATEAQRKALDDQIKALQDFQAKAPKATDRADAQGKINDLLVQQAKLQRESGNAAIEMGIKQQQATQAYRDSLNEVNAKILELEGNLGKAAEIRFDQQNRQLRALAEASGDFASVAQIDRLREYTRAQADINALQQKFSLAQGDLSIAEERITQARERGTMGEIQSLQASGAARREAVAIMQQQLEKFQAIDAAARTPEQAQAIERLKVQLEGLKATVDPLADKFNNLLGDAAGNAFGDFISGSKSAKEAFKDFANTVISEIARMAAKDLAKSLFGGGGAATGGVGFNFGSLLSSFFGGGGGGGDALGDFISLKGFDSGGFTGMGAANDPAGIVHKGEYVLTAEQTKRIGVANLDRGNFSNGANIVNVTVPGRIDRETATQVANQISLQQRRSRRLA